MSSVLSTGCIRRVHQSSAQAAQSDGAVVQVLEVKKIELKAGQSGERYRLVISDGEFYIQGMLATQLNELVQSGELRQNALIRLNDYIANEINGKKVIIMLNVSVIGHEEPIGNPQNVASISASSGVPQPFGGVKQEMKRSQPSFMQKGGAAAAAGNGYGEQPGAVPTQFHPIASLHPYHARWTIKARVTAKGEKRTWSNAKGEGALFSVDLLDAQGGQIKATMFRDAVDKFYDVFQENHVYIISKGQLKPANKKFSRLPNEYELTLNSDAEVIPVENDASIETTRFDFVPIESLNQVQPNEFVDILGVCVSVGPLTNLTSKAGQELRKRALTLLDKTLCQVECTLWGEQADKWNEHTLGETSIVAVKSCKVSDFGGRSLSSSFQSQIFVNPDHPEAHALRAWYDANGAALTDLQNLSKQSRGGEGGPAGAAGNQRKTLSDIKDEGLGMKDKPDFFLVRATITFFKHDWEKGSLPWYNACPGPNCNKKVVEENGAWHCDKCNRNYPNCSPRYILSLMVCDPTGSTWLTAFDDAAKGLLGGTSAGEMADLVNQQLKEQASLKFKEHNFAEYLFKIRAKAEIGQDQEQRVRAHIITASRVNYAQEAAYLFDEIAKYE